MDQGQQRVAATREASDEARAVLNVVAEAVSAINTMNVQIASATEEQGSVAEEINRNVVNICSVFEDSANGANETAAASEELARLAAQLNELVQQFRT